MAEPLTLVLTVTDIDSGGPAEKLQALQVAAAKAASQAMKEVLPEDFSIVKFRPGGPIWIGLPPAAVVKALGDLLPAE